MYGGPVTCPLIWGRVVDCKDHSLDGSQMVEAELINYDYLGKKAHIFQPALMTYSITCFELKMLAFTYKTLHCLRPLYSLCLLFCNTEIKEDGTHKRHYKAFLKAVHFWGSFSRIKFQGTQQGPLFSWVEGVQGDWWDINRNLNGSFLLGINYWEWAQGVLCGFKQSFPLHV